jgi:Kef-type K+ transport system membrane component KefB
MEALTYQAPPPNDLLPQASFFPALYLFAYVFELLKSCGLVGQILVGIIWGKPLTSWLGLDFQNTISSLGYIGLISLVFEGKAQNIRR